jgi:hypothetical protein
MADDPCVSALAEGERFATDLEAAELFVVGALRAWVAPLMRPGRPHPDWREIFQLAGVPPLASDSFDSMMSVLSHSAARLIDVRCCRCPSISRDEIGMLLLVGGLQDGDLLAAVEVLHDWLHPGVVPVMYPPAQRFAAMAGAAGLRLPKPAHGRRLQVASVLH